MRPHRLLSAAIVMLALAGCTPDRPEGAEREERAIASVVALLVGYESDGLSSLLADLAADSLTAEQETALVIPASNAAPGRLFVRSRHGTSALGESRTRCIVRPAGALAPGAGESVSIDLDGVSLHASDAVSIRATTSGSIHLASAGRLLERFASGEVRVAGALGDRPGGDVPFTSIQATFTFSHLRLVDVGAAEGPALDGTVAISIAASGPNGMIIRNGVLELEGDDHGTLEITGRHYPIDVRSARVTGRGR